VEPINAAGQAVPIIERGGVVAAVIICAAIIVFGMATAVIVLWKGKESAIAMVQSIQVAHYQSMLDEVARKTELEHKLADNLDKHLAAIQALRETLVQLTERVSRA
jgi:hypothetical protein